MCFGVSGLGFLVLHQLRRDTDEFRESKVVCMLSRSGIENQPEVYTHHKSAKNILAPFKSLWEYMNYMHSLKKQRASTSAQVHGP